MSAKKRSRLTQSSPLLRYGAMGFVAVNVIAALGFFVLGLNGAPAPINPNATDIAATLPRSDTAFNVGTRVGQPAPAFTLNDAQDKPYAFRPGDG